MKKTIQTAVFASMFLVVAQVSAKTAILDLNYIATNNYGITNTSVGTITLTDLADLNLGDGKTGVRTTVRLNNLNQFASGNTGAVWISSYELNFAGTELNGNDNYRHVAGLNTNSIEWEENGCVSTGASCGSPQQGWGGTQFDPAFGQEINFATSTFTNGQFSTIDYLNGGAIGYNGFSVDNLLNNAVVNNDGTGKPDAFAWIRIRGNTAANGGGLATSGYWGNSFANGSGTGLNYRLNVLATSATVVPEAETYSMMLMGLAAIGAIARRRKA